MLMIELIPCCWRIYHGTDWTDSSNCSIAWIRLKITLYACIGLKIGYEFIPEWMRMMIMWGSYHRWLIMGWIRKHIHWYSILLFNIWIQVQEFDSLMHKLLLLYCLQTRFERELNAKTTQEGIQWKIVIIVRVCILLREEKLRECAWM